MRSNGLLVAVFLCLPVCLAEEPTGPASDLKDFGPAKSAPGSLFACQREISIWVMHRDGVHGKNLGRGAYPAWSPDGRRIAMIEDDNICVAGLDAGTRTRLTKLNLMCLFESWSPDGKSILFSAGNNDGIWGLYAVQVAGGKPVLLAERHHPGRARWSVDGAYTLYSLNGHTYQKPASGGPGKALCETVYAKMSPDGNHIAFSSARHRLTGEMYVMNTKTRQQRRVALGEPTQVLHMAWSADSGRIAFNGRVDPADYGIFVAKADGTGFRRIIKSSTFPYFLVWSPDGQRIAFSQSVKRSVSGGHWTCTVNSEDGSGLAWVHCDKGSSEPVGWSPDGKALAIYTFVNGKQKVMRLDMASKRLEAFPAELPGWVSKERAKRHIFDIEKDGTYHYRGAAPEQPDPRRVPSHDGKMLVTVEPMAPEGDELFLQDLRTKKKRRLTKMPQTAKWRPLWSFDDRYVLFGSGTTIKRHGGPEGSGGPPPPEDGLYVLDVTTGKTKQLVAGGRMRCAWQPVPK
jgi:Tol biopolymer transport system component